MAEKLIKSKERAKKYAEVYTPRWVVDKMCDLLQEENPDMDCFAPDKTFLEPSCGNGNFLVVILERKLQRCRTDEDIRTAVGSIYGVDLLPDNIAEARERMQSMLPFDCTEILERNIVQGNFLEPENIWFLADEAETLHAAMDQYSPKGRRKNAKKKRKSSLSPCTKCPSKVCTLTRGCPKWWKWFSQSWRRLQLAALGYIPEKKTAPAAEDAEQQKSQGE